MARKTMTTRLDSIAATLSAGSSDTDLEATARGLLSAIGYDSGRTLEGQSGDVADFIRQYPAPNAGTQSEEFLRDNAASVKIVFQVTDSEIESVTSRQGALFDTSAFDRGRERSFLFAAVALRDDGYARGAYTRLTREINKRFPMPTVVIFRAGGKLTVAFAHRRAHRRDAERDVLGSVSLIRGIEHDIPHRAHLEILSDLSLTERLRWMDAHGKSANFDGLLAAWLNALDTEELNRRFYRDLFDWFQRAVSVAKFPAKGRHAQTPEEHVIRLITRLMFVWFIKEKGLVADDLFIEARVRDLLREYDADGGDSYYRAVLQNLFFATLNTEVGARGFRTAGRPAHRVFNRYRYKSEISDPEGLSALFSETPFINGGLFDCLDSEEAEGSGGYRIDCFTDNPRHRRGFSIPNRLFFSQSPESLGLIPLFEKYKFTVEENTPVEQEVALDPELLGKVFENLLAAYNPETRETARKQTGSYYTPRPVVDYMVNEALVASLSERTLPKDTDAEMWQERLRDMLDYSFPFEESDGHFTDDERRDIVTAVAEMRTLDPAVGSGAFPMGILHKLTLALRRVDWDNSKWADLQKQNALEPDGGRHGRAVAGSA